MDVPAPALWKPAAAGGNLEIKAGLGPTDKSFEWIFGH